MTTNTSTFIYFVRRDISVICWGSETWQILTLETYFKYICLWATLFVANGYYGYFYGYTEIWYTLHV